MFKKKLSVAISAAMVAGVTAISTGVQAAEATTANVGDLAMVPYYTTNGNLITGVHITNTSPNTQVVKVRLREREESKDAIDFIVVMSPYDVWTGAISDNNETGAGGTGAVAVWSDDETCTVPAKVDGYIFPKNDDGSNAVMSGAEEGYIEIIAMGQTTSEITLENPLAYYAVHSGGVPNDCSKVEESFEAPRIDSTNPALLTGVFANDTTYTSHEEVIGGLPVGVGLPTTYENADNPLRVSYFIRDAETGLEFGNTAVHVKDFADLPMMANQEFGLADSESRPILPSVWHQAGYDFPDLDGGAAANGGPTGLYNDLRSLDVLGANGISNDWSVNSLLGVSVDWTVTFPGQYLMPGGNSDLPVTVAQTVWDREEGMAPPRGLVVSPSGAYTNEWQLEDEANVIEWFGGSVLGAIDPYEISDNNVSDNFNPQYGWAQLDFTAANAGNVVNRGTTNVNDLDETALGDPISEEKTGSIVTMGYAAWQRTFAADLNRNYGRIAEHTFIRVEEE